MFYVGSVQGRLVHSDACLRQTVGTDSDDNLPYTERSGAQRDAQRPRQHAFGLHTTIHTGLHGLSDVTELLFNLFLALQRQFVLHPPS